jgi:hypothetical protein
MGGGWAVRLGQAAPLFFTHYLVSLIRRLQVPSAMMMSASEVGSGTTVSRAAT